MCESVPVAQSAGEDQGRLWPEKTEREGKTNTGNMVTDRTLLDSGAELPRGHLWDCADPPCPRGHQMEPDTTTAVYKSRQSRRSQQAKASTVRTRP